MVHSQEVRLQAEVHAGPATSEGLLSREFWDHGDSEHDLQRHGPLALWTSYPMERRAAEGGPEPGSLKQGLVEIANVRNE